MLRQTTRDLRRHNRAALLCSLYLRGPASRLELVAESGLSPATVTNVVAELIADGLVAEAGSVESDGGRPRTLLRVRPDFARVVGVDVGETHVCVGLFDCALETLATVQLPLGGTNLEPVEVARQVRAEVTRVLGECGVAPDGVLGVGVGVPGAVRDGGVVHAPTLGWAGIGFGDLLRAHLPVAAPVHLDNRARTLGQAEMWRGAGRGAERAVIALLGVGVGAAFVTGGASFPAITTTEWGHTVVQSGGADCRCGSRGCLEAYVGAEAVVRRYLDKPGSEPVHGGQAEAQLAEVAARARTSGAAAEALAETGEYLGIGIANLINLLAPDRVVLAGSAGAVLGRAVVAHVRTASARHALAYLAESTAIEPGHLGPEAVALGAATLPIEALLASGGRTAA
ncbi:ROK family transcriptional regulator [Amycolatopsis ultiminotia]|uniref:ROK family transcriptional regulator n=1 Tax=Amycolatopsis ultiminotia TaxID=543629 RepID=A0ABP6YFE0_9PSEU